MKFHVLFDSAQANIPLNGSADEGPALDSLDSLLPRLRAAQAVLRAVAVDDLIGLCDAAAAAWTQPEHPAADVIREQGLGFLPLWMRRANLVSVCSRALRGHPEALDGFVRLSDGDPLLLRAQPRGLVVHWVAGNVPVLGMLSLLQAALCKNASLVKVSRLSPGVLPHLLQLLASVEYVNRSGRTLSGRLLTDAVVVLYADRADAAAARALSQLADIRVAWGGQEAIDAITGLPRRYGAEDVVFGPKTSLAVVGAERLSDGNAAGRAAMAIAHDAAAFEQQGCNSPHTVFVERGGAVTPVEFAKLLAGAMESVCRRAPLRYVAPGAAMNVLGTRAEYDMRGEAWYGSGMNWTVVYGEQDEGLADPCFLRTLFVRPIDDVFAVASLCSRHTQTVGLAVDDRRPALADALTAQGVDRCPNVGNMRLYESPWDGMFMMERLVRWVSTY